jgi:hypothetical protein
MLVGVGLSGDAAGFAAATGKIQDASMAGARIRPITTAIP